jgi:hypothetical protein
MAVEASKTTEGFFSCRNTFHILLINKRPLGISRMSSRGPIFRRKVNYEEGLVGNVVEPEQDKDPE